jgi:hypothetical protein
MYLELGSLAQRLAQTMFGALTSLASYLRNIFTLFLSGV